MYTDWYVLYVATGRELFIKDVIAKNTNQSIELLTFQRELLHSRNGKKVKVLDVLFPGYVFVYKEVDLAVKISKQFLSKEFVCPVSFNGRPSQVDEEEMKFLFQATANTGTFQLSQILKNDNKIEVIDGPLKTLKGNILWIDEKKNKAKVELFLFKRKMRVNLGLRLVNMS